MHTLEFPRYVFPLLFSAWMFIGVWAVLLYRHRKGDGNLRFPVVRAGLHSCGSRGSTRRPTSLVFFLPVQAPGQGHRGRLVRAQPADHLLRAARRWPWPTTIIPEGDRPPHPPLRLGKIRLLDLASCSPPGQATYDLIDGPVPAWMSSVAVAASLLTFAAPLCDDRHEPAGHHERTATAACATARRCGSSVVGVWCFVAAVIGGVGALSGSAASTRWSTSRLMTVAGGHLLMYGFVSFSLFGAVYYIVPRLLGTEWALARR